MLTSRYGAGYGMGYSSYKEATYLSKLGHEVTVAHCNEHIEDYTHDNITTIHIPNKKIILLDFVYFYFKLKKLPPSVINKFDIVYIQSLEYGLLDFNKIKVPIFYFSRSTIIGINKTIAKKHSLLKKINNKILIILEKRCLNYAGTVLVKSEIMRKEVHSLYNISKDKIKTIIGGIDIKDYHKEDALTKNETKNKYSIPGDKKIILYIGRIVPQKGLVYLIYSALLLFEKRKDFVIVVAGENTDNEYTKEIKKIINNSKQSKNFYFLGHIDQLKTQSIFNIADCVVTPSLYEPFGMVNLQAAYLNKPIITTSVVGSLDILKKYKNLIIIEPKSINNLADGINKVLEKNKHAQNINFDEYSWKNVTKKLINIFNNIK